MEREKKREEGISIAKSNSSPIFAFLVEKANDAIPSTRKSKAENKIELILYRRVHRVHSLSFRIS